MTHRLATVGTFWNPIDANLAKNELEDAGIRAFLQGEQASGMVWHMANAFGGIQLQVEDCDAEEARAILAASNTEEVAANEPVDEMRETSLATIDEPGAAKCDEPDEDDAAWVLTRREQNAQRALRAALLGLLFLPLQIYSFWLLLKVAASDERLDPPNRRRAIAATTITLPLLIVVWMLLRSLLLK